jgi:hypothetical protein
LYFLLVNTCALAENEHDNGKDNNGEEETNDYGDGED